MSKGDSGAAMAFEDEGPSQLAHLRGELDDIDNRLLRTVADRFSVCRRIAELKRDKGIPMMQPSRVTLVLDRATEFGRVHDINSEFLRELYRVMIEEICRVEDGIIDGSGESARPTARV